MKEVVIKISDAMYKYITMEHTICIKEVGEYLFGLVRCTGTILPKGHGRLIDADAIKPIKAPIAPLTPEGAVHYEWVYMKSEIDRAPTIIEADKEGEQE